MRRFLLDGFMQFLVIIGYGGGTMNAEALTDLARHQAWADAAHWKAFHENAALWTDAEIHTRLNHMLGAQKMLVSLASGKIPDPATMKQVEPMDTLEASMQQAHADLAAALASTDLDKMVSLPRGPKGPFEAPAGVIFFQALMHGQHHRGQNASRMRQLSIPPPMTDYIAWYALGRP
ncbi:MAG: DinB family protein [Bryobacteraceae bacterium]